ncbi:MAG: GDSL-type esterase/lipase family protein [Tannerella sp.]|jgi:lysophospholipase L1-like esterase|nr:GDSL-type esterase/lipase family protein [Tannerella sp.]
MEKKNTWKGKTVMNSPKRILILFSILNIIGFHPAQAQIDSAQTQVDSLQVAAEDSTEALVAISTLLSPFSEMRPNVIADSSHALSPFFEKLNALHEDVDSMPRPVVRVVHIGDSHVRSHEITPVLHSYLAEMFGSASDEYIKGYKSKGIVPENGSPGVVCQCVGINGATSRTFLEKDYLKTISDLLPDLIIISLGTNESFNRYDPDIHYNMMESLFSALTDTCHHAVILYTTPPGSFKTVYTKARRRANRKIISVDENKKTEEVTATIIRFAADHHAACWDLYHIMGGDEYACKNWLNGNLFKVDKIHFLKDGYRIQGYLLYDALINGFNGYVSQ